MRLRTAGRSGLVGLIRAATVEAPQADVAILADGVGLPEGVLALPGASHKRQDARIRLMATD